MAGANPQESLMFDVPCLSEDVDAINWRDPRIPRLVGAVGMVYVGIEGTSAYNNHSYLAEFDRKLWAMWSTHPTRGNYHGMYVRYATSEDGLNWSLPADVTPVPAGKRFVARGFWVRDGKLLALASLDSNEPGGEYWAAPDLELRAYRWNGSKWEDAGVVFDDTLNNYPPKRLPDGQWIMERRDYRFELSLLKGGVKGIGEWEAFELPNPEGRSFNEPDFIVRPGGEIAMHIRDNSRSKRIYRSVSKDSGRTWSVPARTNFPDATSKNFNLRLSSGLYILVNNPNTKRRIPLTVAVSADGVVYDRIAILEDADEQPRIPGHDKGPGYTYPHAVERDGHVYFIHARHRDDIVVRRVAVKDIEGIDNAGSCIEAVGGDSPELLLADRAPLRNPMRLPLVPSRTSMVHRAKRGEWHFNLHSYITHFDGRFWATWSAGPLGEASLGQHVRYAASPDGHNWSESRVLASDPDGPEGKGRWINRGIYMQDGRLTALASYVEGTPRDLPAGDLKWAALKLMRFEWTGGEWKPRGVYVDDCVSNYPPRMLDGRWFMTCRDSYRRTSTAWAAPAGKLEWELDRLPGSTGEGYSEPTWYEAADGTVHLVMRDATKSKFLLRSVSRDRGRTWPQAVKTNYPDATSKIFTGILSNGWYYLINNPNQRARDPLAISFSKNGWAFGRPKALRKGAAEVRLPEEGKGSRSFQYPHAMERDGSLWVIYSTNKEDIEISEYKIVDFDL